MLHGEMCSMILLSISLISFPINLTVILIISQSAELLVDRILVKPLCLLVGRLVGWSVGWSHFTFFNYFSLTSLLLPKWSGDLKYGPCPPARDFGSRVSGLVFILASLLITDFFSLFLSGKFSSASTPIEKKRRRSE